MIGIGRTVAIERNMTDDQANVFRLIQGRPMITRTDEDFFAVRTFCNALSRTKNHGIGFTCA